MADYAKMTVPLLREQLAARGLDTGGLKAALVARLVAAAEVGAPAAEPAAQVAALPPAAEAAPAAPPPAPPVAAEPAPPPARVEAKRKEPEPSVAPASASVPPASAEEAPARKRSRWDSADAAAPAAPAAHAPPALPTAGETAAAAAPDAATKAREMLQKKNELAEKLAKLRQLKGAAGAGAAPAAPPASALPSSLAGVLAPDAVARVQAIASRLAAGGPTQAGLLRAPGTTGFSAAPALAPPAPRSRPVALRLDAQGREVDEAGNVIVREVKATATLRVNARAQKAEELRALMDEARREVAAETAAGGVDEAAKRRARESRSLQFLDPGLVTQRAEASRMQAALRAQFGDAADAEARKLAARAKRREDEAARIAGYEAAGAAEAAAGHAGADVAEADVPDTEWWDAPLLGGASYDGVLSGTAAMAVDKISVYVEHPVPLMPPGEAPPPPPQPLKLTAKEQKKLRTQRRVAREKERQEMLRQGLLEPPKPKVRIANLMRVLGEQATADPTAIEKEVRAQMAERAAAHEDRNAARALTPAERREKQARKLFEETNGGGELQCAVYRVESLAHPLNKYKVILNAEENQLTGCGLRTEAFALVIIEGARKAVTRYNKLMLRRMNWKLRREPRDADGGGEGEDDTGVAAEVDEEARRAREEEEEARCEANKCTLVWQGAVLKPAFKRFKFEPIRSAAGAAKFLEDMGLRNFWDLAAAGVSIE